MNSMDHNKFGMVVSFVSIFFLIAAFVIGYFIWRWIWQVPTIYEVPVNTPVEIPADKVGVEGGKG